jgi:hypothetical protein
MICNRCEHPKDSDYHKRMCRISLYLWRGKGYCIFCNEPLVDGHSCADTPTPPVKSKWFQLLKSFLWFR